MAATNQPTTIISPRPYLREMQFLNGGSMSDIAELGRNWDELAKNDPFWAILTFPHAKGNRWNIEQFFATGVTEVTELFEYLQSSGFSFSKGRALDFGCGVGRLTQALALHFEEVVGVDISPTFVELASQYNRQG
jgi:2-polyprenyl-3-methyl-5-hydroxy-6-metoxy-1,4-benzoquinol methylase